MPLLCAISIFCVMLLLASVQCRAKYVAVPHDTAKHSPECPLHKRGYWASSLIYGRNVEPDHTSNSFLAESTAFLKKKHWVWGRAEYLDRESFHGKVTAFTAGYAHEIPSPSKWLSFSLGGQFNWYRVPPEAKLLYGSSPVGAQITLRASLKSSRMSF